MKVLIKVKPTLKNKQRFVRHHTLPRMNVSHEFEKMKMTINIPVRNMNVKIKRSDMKINSDSM